jgi:acetyl esterase/lipase
LEKGEIKIMLSKSIKVWEDRNDVILETYILDNSREYNKDKKRPAILICPGGGYIWTSDREAEPVALKFAQSGYHTFVLRYTTSFNKKIDDYSKSEMEKINSVMPQALFDISKAILMIRENSDEWNISKNNVTICGFSAGGHLVTSLAVQWKSDLLKDKFNVDSKLLRPDSVIAGYPVVDIEILHDNIKTYKDLTNIWNFMTVSLFGKLNPTSEELYSMNPLNFIDSDTPPFFIWHTCDDGLVHALNSINLAKKLSENNVPFDMHIFEKGDHGLSVCDETSSEFKRQINKNCREWVNLATNWLGNRKIVKE